MGVRREEEEAGMLPLGWAVEGVVAGGDLIEETGEDREEVGAEVWGVELVIEDS